MSLFWIIILIFILFCFGCFFIFLYIKNPNGKGKVGEYYTEQEINRVKKIIYGKVLRNIYIPKEDSSTSEIDVLFICTKGLFVLESKNYSGWIFGNERDKFWTATLPKGKGKEILYES